MRNLLDLVQSAARRTPNAESLVCGDVRLSYFELLKRCHAFGQALSSVGVAPGERVAIFLDKRMETVVSMLGAGAAGCVFVPVNPLLKPKQVAHVLRDSGARCLVTTALRARSLAAEGVAQVADVILVDEPDSGLTDRRPQPGFTAGRPIASPVPTATRSRLRPQRASTQTLQPFSIHQARRDCPRA